MQGSDEHLPGSELWRPGDPAKVPEAGVPQQHCQPSQGGQPCWDDRGEAFKHECKVWQQVGVEKVFLS